MRTRLFITTPIREPTDWERVQGYLHIEELLTLTVRSNVPWDLWVRVLNVAPLNVFLYTAPQLWVAVGRRYVRLTQGPPGKHVLELGLTLKLNQLPSFLLLEFRLPAPPVAIGY